MYKAYKVDRDELTCVEVPGKGKLYRSDFVLDTEDDEVTKTRNGGFGSTN